jgi:NAD(P)H-dependent FMN reductase
VSAVARVGGTLRYETLDLAEVNLPFLDEPLMAALGNYEHEHTKAWSRIVSAYDGFIFVFPQYNWGYPAPLKNALDSFVTYGTHGGSRAADQFSGLLRGLHMIELADHLEVVITDEDVDASWQLRDLDAVMFPYTEQTRAIDAQMVAALEGSA